MLLCMACLPGTLTRCFRVRVNSHRVKVLILGSLPYRSSSLTLILSELFQFGSSEPAFETYVKNPSVNAGGSTVETGLESDPSSPPPHHLPSPSLLPYHCLPVCSPHCSQRSFQNLGQMMSTFCSHPSSDFSSCSE